jgi:hypothetical protein
MSLLRITEDDASLPNYKSSVSPFSLLPPSSSAMRHVFCTDPFMVSLGTKKNVAWY